MSEGNAETEKQSSPQDTNASDLSEVPFSLTPAHFLAAASLPLCIGTYVGFKRQLKIVEKEARAAHLEKEISIALTRESKSVATRALGIGTLLSVSSFGLVGAVVFYASGFRTWGETVTYLHEWGPRRRRDFENFLGIDTKRHTEDADVQATRNMTSDEEVEYYRTKYFSDAEVNGQEGGAGKGSSQTQ